MLIHSFVQPCRQIPLPQATKLKADLLREEGCKLEHKQHFVGEEGGRGTCFVVKTFCFYVEVLLIAVFGYKNVKHQEQWECWSKYEGNSQK